MHVSSCIPKKCHYKHKKYSKKIKNSQNKIYKIDTYYSKHHAMQFPLNKQYALVRWK